MKVNEHDDDMTSRTLCCCIFSRSLWAECNVPPDCKHMISTIHKFQLHLRAARGCGENLSGFSRCLRLRRNLRQCCLAGCHGFRLSPATSSPPIKRNDGDESLVSRKGTRTWSPLGRIVKVTDGDVRESTPWLIATWWRLREKRRNGDERTREWKLCEGKSLEKNKCDTQFERILTATVCCI